MKVYLHSNDTNEGNIIKLLKSFTVYKYKVECGINASIRSPWHAYLDTGPLHICYSIDSNAIEMCNKFATLEILSQQII